jgi:ATP dependent DNA ligase C terminal region/ATP dependent DNA ligase domain
MGKLVDLELLNAKIGTYRTGTVAALKDAENLLAQAKMRRRQMSQMMIAYDHATSKRRLSAGQYLISRKIDGEFTCMLWQDGPNGGEVCSLNPYGTVRAGAPFHDEFARMMAKSGVKRAIIGGELHVNRADLKRARVHDVCRIARAPEAAEDVASLNYAVFAIYDLDGVDMIMQPMEQLAKIRQLFSGGTRVHPMETVEGSEADVQAKFQQWVVTEGGEGLVVRSEKFGWYKIKPRHTIDVAVVGYSHGIEDRAGMLHSLLLALVREDGTYHVIGRTGGGFSDQQRITMVDDLAKLVVESTYAEVNSDRVAYKMIKPGLVAEISCLDIISETSDGSTIDRMVIEWNAGTSSWAGVRRLPFASIISPQFEKLRTDKVASVDDTGPSQLTRVIELPDDVVGVQGLHLPKAEILKRAVATKELKGKTMVRKLLLWKTNKEQLSPDFPAYVLLLTDYSPNRKTPLERDIRVSVSLEQIETYWTAWSTENFVKGWVMK